MDLFGYAASLPEPPKAKAFDGETYVAERDYERLSGQLKAVFDLMQDGKWRTLAEIRQTVEGTETAISARLRDLRKAKYGSRQVVAQYVSRGLHRYKLVVT